MPGANQRIDDVFTSLALPSGIFDLIHRDKTRLQEDLDDIFFV